jgi:hypothetical protein
MVGAVLPLDLSREVSALAILWPYLLPYSEKEYARPRGKYPPQAIYLCETIIRSWRPLNLLP